MKATFAALALAGAAVAAPHSHAQFHKKDTLSGLFNSLSSSDNSGSFSVSNLIAESSNFLSLLGAQSAVNSQTPTSDSWVGGATSGNAVVNTIVNQGDKDVFFTCWGSEGSWVNTNKPTVSIRVPAKNNATVSHAVLQDGTTNTGACAFADQNTQLVNGQISNSWFEFNFGNSQWKSSTFDVSMEPNMAGHNISVAGPNCKSDHQTCVYKCNNGATTCGEAGTYELLNCAAGSQVGATYGLFAGQPAGGCQDVENTGISKLTTTLHN